MNSAIPIGVIQDFASFLVGLWDMLRQGAFYAVMRPPALNLAVIPSMVNLGAGKVVE